MEKAAFMRQSCGIGVLGCTTEVYQHNVWVWFDFLPTGIEHNIALVDVTVRDWRCKVVEESERRRELQVDV